MIATFYFLRFPVLLLAAALLSACNTSNVGNSLEATPVATENSQATPQTNPASNSSTQTDVSSSNALAANEAPNAATNAVSEQIAETETQVAALDDNNSISFQAVEGVPQSAFNDLSNALKNATAENGLTVYPQNRPGAKYQVKGYFSALDDGSGTLIVYIWDVMDASGKRVHRINGQERSSSTSVNPWQAVSKTDLQRVADTTAARLKSWSDSL